MNNEYNPKMLYQSAIFSLARIIDANNILLTSQLPVTRINQKRLIIDRLFSYQLLNLGYTEYSCQFAAPILHFNRHMGIICY